MTAKDEEKRQDGAAEVPEVKESVSSEIYLRRSFPRVSKLLPSSDLPPPQLLC